MRVLVVDDEPDIRRLVAQALTSRGMAVDTAEDAAGALRLLSGQAYDVLLLDVLMPGTTGVQLLPTIVRDHPDVRVMMVSALNEPRVRVNCLEAGAVDYLAKPFVLAELVARVRAHARKPVPTLVPAQERRARERRAGDRRVVADGQAAPPEPGRYLRRAGLMLDLHARRVRTPTAQVALSERECLLLAHLLRRAGEVCGRTELLEAVWGPATAQTSNVVDVYVGRLRSKLPEGTITTVRASGYALRTA